MHLHNERDTAMVKHRFPGVISRVALVSGMRRNTHLPHPRFITTFFRSDGDDLRN